jgi:hypothetical protein
MDSDAYASFVSIDMELQVPDAVIGVIGATECANLVDAGGLRNSLEVIARAAEYWKRKGPAACAIHMGNVVAPEAAAAGSQWDALDSFDEERRRACVPWHFAPGLADHACFGDPQTGATVAAALRPSCDDAGERAWYAVFPCSGWRIIVLDSFDISLVGQREDSEAHATALELLRSQNPNPPGAADPLAGLSGEARRFGPHGGGIGPLQYAEIEPRLSRD